MRQDRVCVNLPDGSTIMESGRWLWTKIHDNMWMDDRSEKMTDRAMDDVLATRGELVIVDKGLATRGITAFDLEEGDYVVMTWGFWNSADAPLFDQEQSQLLFRVAGWHNSDGGDDHWSVILDAPEHLLMMIGWSEAPDGYFEVAPTPRRSSTMSTRTSNTTAGMRCGTGRTSTTSSTHR
jgi:hypothetical protein